MRSSVVAEVEILEQQPIAAEAGEAGRRQHGFGGFSQNRLAHPGRAAESYPIG